MIIPAVLYEDSDILLCKGWIKKRWKHIRKFAKKHRKALIIGAAVIVAATVVVVIVAATSTGAAVATAAGAASGAAPSTKEQKEPSTVDIPSPIAEETSLQSALDSQISSFKETLVQEQFFATNSTNQLSWEENGRALGSLFAHHTYNSLQEQNYTHAFGHHEIDRKFSTDYTHLYPNPSQTLDFNTLSHQVRAEKALSFILVPGALAKVASKSVKSAQELATVCKKLQIAQETLVLETAAGMKNSAKIAEVVETGQRTARIADELGLTAQEMGQLKQTGKLGTTVSNTFENISKNPVIRESFELFDRAQEFLKPYKEFMTETQCRDLIHKTGIPTFTRPMGIPENFRVKIASKGAGLIYMHPEHTHTSIRIMPGKPHSPFPHQQKPYVIYKKNGKTLDKFGNVVNSATPEAHIPVEEFMFTR